MHTTSHVPSIPINPDRTDIEEVCLEYKLKPLKIYYYTDEESKI